MGKKVSVKELREKILERRAQGLSYEEIAEELHMSAEVLMDWTKLFQETALDKGCNC
jgi:orotate phosphoribosyltransferase-like protein